MSINLSIKQGDFQFFGFQHFCTKQTRRLIGRLIDYKKYNFCFLILSEMEVKEDFPRNKKADSLTVS